MVGKFAARAVFLVMRSLLRPEKCISRWAAAAAAAAGGLELDAFWVGGAGSNDREGARLSPPPPPDTAQSPRLLDGLPQDAIPALFAPRFVAAERARIAPGAFVFGYANGGEAHAYALNLLDGHEVVNDVVGARAVAATW